MKVTLKAIDIENVIRRAISAETRIPEDQLKFDEPLESYGIESVMGVAIVRRLEETFGELSKTLLFEYQSIESLLGYFREEYGDGATNAATTFVGENLESQSVTANLAVPLSVQSRTIDEAKPRIDNDAIAIIGISGRFPEADSLEEFWEHISRGDDCITEIPERLWDWKEYWHPERGEPGKSYSKWGGFIKDSDCFDPLFFGISNVVAEGMDPQERLFLETVHHTLENAGYTRESLRGKSVGLYVSVMWGSYQHYGARDASTDSSFSSIANRASYFFDLRGPSIALDTTCSGSLTTVHLACESLRAGETDLAIAGGVNITSHPHKYLVLSRTGFASTDGRCRSFAADANGYVPGDGVGAVLLKPLSKAISDGDRIWAVIKGSSVNHGGRSSGYTVPSADAQTSLISQALKRSNIDPRTITYVEAHAPGTALGDPIELRGLINAFRQYTNDTGFCAIGSVKSNIGHLESAAGFASLTKVVLQMRHRQLAPSIHADKLNPNINLSNTPFFIQQELENWETPIVPENGHTARRPRRAAISAFGFGGSNAHVILEEFVTPVNRRVPDTEHLIVLSAKTSERLQVVVKNLLKYIAQHLNTANSVSESTPVAEQVRSRISAITNVNEVLFNNETHLRYLLSGPASREALASDLQRVFGIALEAQQMESSTIGELVADISQRMGNSARGSADRLSLLLEQIAFTLQVGREAMEHRFATVVSSLPQLQQRFEGYLSANAEMEQSCTGKVLNIAANVGARVEEREYVERLVTSHQYESLARLWCNGVTIPWHKLYSDPKPARIDLPLYPFARERCWFAPATQSTSSERVMPSTPALSSDHISAPVEVEPNGHLAANVSDIQSLIFRPRWSPVAATLKTASVVNTPSRALFIYHRSASSLIEAFKRLLRTDQAYEIVLGKRTELLGQHSWEIDLFDENAIKACLTHIDSLETVYFFGGYEVANQDVDTSDTFKRAQAQSAFVLFRLLKALQDYETRNGKTPQLKVITNVASAVRENDPVKPYTSSVLGFVRAAMREYPRLSIQMIDVDLPEDLAQTKDIHTILGYVRDGIAGHAEFAIRDARPYIRELAPYDLGEMKPVFKQRGLYLLIGGAGVIGSKLSRYLANTLSARLVWVGRRPCDDSISRSISEIESLGGHLDYYAADAANINEMQRVLDVIEQKHGGIDGVLHLAMVHGVSRIRDLQESQLTNTFAAKVDSTYALYSLLRRRNPGFVVLFSSAESYVGNIGWAPYAGACSFQDTFALYWMQQASYPVLSVNWGYWEVEDQEVGEMLTAKGIRQLSVAQGVTILERALANRTSQVIALNVDTPVLERMGILPRSLPVRDTKETVETAAVPKPEVIPPVQGTAGSLTVEPLISPNLNLPVQDKVSVAAEDLPSPELVTEGLLDVLSSVLKIEKARFEPDVDLINYGIDSLTIVALQKTIEERVGSVPATLFITSQTINAVVANLREQYPEAARLLAGKKNGTPATPKPVVSPAAPATGLATDVNLTMLRLVEPPDILPYLDEYGGRFREGQLEQAAASTTVQTLSQHGPKLAHLLVDTPTVEKMELFAVGSGVPVLLLPAVGLTAPTWRYQLNSLLNQTMRLFVAHPPGYGLTKPIQNCTTRGIAGTMKQVIDLISPGRPVHLVGSCLGCVAAMYLARFHPERIASLTLIGAFHSPAEMLVGDPARLTASEFEHILVSAVDRIKDDFAATTRPIGPNGNGAAPATDALLAFLLNGLCANALIAMRYLNEMLTMSPLEWLSGITIPTQCICGTNDKIVKPKQSKEIAEAIPGADLLMIDGAGHFPYLTHSEQFNAVVESFVRRQVTRQIPV